MGRPAVNAGARFPCCDQPARMSLFGLASHTRVPKVPPYACGGLHDLLGLDRAGLSRRPSVGPLAVGIGSEDFDLTAYRELRPGAIP